MTPSTALALFSSILENTTTLTELAVGVLGLGALLASREDEE